MLFPTTIVGSFPQPDWLIDREKLAGRFPPRVRARELWRIPPQYLSEAQDDATLMAIRAQEEAGLDIVSDGEIRRESYSNRFATALDGVDLDNPGTALDRSGHPNPVPRIVGRIRRRHAVEVEDLNFLRAHTDRKVKITVPGPFTMLQQAQNDFYASDEEAAMDYAAAVNAEIKDLFAAGADVVQIDEPYMQARPEKARQYGLAALNRALQGVQGTTAVHICFGYAAIIHQRPSGYSFLPELAQCSCRQVSIETAQSQLDCSVLQTLGDKQVRMVYAPGRTREPVINRPTPKADRARFCLSEADVLELAGQFVIEASTSPQQLQPFFAEVVRLLLDHAQAVDAAALRRARQQIAVRHLRELEKPSRRLESAALDLFALGRLRSRAETLQALQDVGADQVRDCFGTMLQAGASVAVAGKLQRGADALLRDWASPLWPAPRSCRSSGPGIV